MGNYLANAGFFVVGSLLQYAGIVGGASGFLSEPRDVPWIIAGGLLYLGGKQVSNLGYNHMAKDDKQKEDGPREKRSPLEESVSS